MGEKSNVVDTDRDGQADIAEFVLLFCPYFSKGHWRFWKILHYKLRCRERFLIK